MTGTATLALLLLTWAAPAWPQEARPSEAGPSWSASGYLKNLWQYSASSIDRRPFFLNVARERLSLDAAWSALKAHAEYDHEQIAGSYLRTREYRLFGLAEPPRFLDTDLAISTADTVVWRQRLHRWWAAVETEDTLVRLGRQRVTWGTGKFFSPTDILNPHSPFSAEKDERPGTDALYLRRSLGDLSQAELAWAPEDRWTGHSLLGRVRTNLRSFDLALMGGKTASRPPASPAPSPGSWILGGDAAGSLWDGTVRGEWAYSDPGMGRPYWKLCVGWDYSFGSDARFPGLKDLSLMLEYFHDGSGTVHSTRYDTLRVLSGRGLTLAKDYASLGFTKDLHPLVKLDMTLIVNLDDASSHAATSLTWDAGRNLFLTAGIQRLSGTRHTEFGRRANLGYLQTQWYF
ncbi:MAG: hypothetical protein HZB91_14470 [Elusimicrobia bacterium]|nr:hypothetical protein [Elusimicrobiota bacterium]